MFTEKLVFDAVNINLKSADLLTKKLTDFLKKRICGFSNRYRNCFFTSFKAVIFNIILEFGFHKPPHAHAVIELRKVLIKIVNGNTSARIKIEFISGIRQSRIMLFFESVPELFNYINDLCRLLFTVRLDFFKSFAVVRNTYGNSRNTLHGRI